MNKLQFNATSFSDIANQALAVSWLKLEMNNRFKVRFLAGQLLDQSIPDPILAQLMEAMLWSENESERKSWLQKCQARYDKLQARGNYPDIVCLM